MSEDKTGKQALEKGRADHAVRLGLLGAVVGGWYVQLLYAFSSESSLGNVASAFAILWFASGAAFFVGTLAGFVFGLKDPSPPGVTVTRDPLEEIRDWLTKIIVGLGLVEFREVMTFLGNIGETIGLSFDDGSGGGQVVAISSILFGFVCGFLYYYLWARHSSLSGLPRPG